MAASSTISITSVPGVSVVDPSGGLVGTDSPKSLAGGECVSKGGLAAESINGAANTLASIVAIIGFAISTDAQWISSAGTGDLPLLETNANTGLVKTKYTAGTANTNMAIISRVGMRQVGCRVAKRLLVDSRIESVFIPSIMPTSFPRKERQTACQPVGNFACYCAGLTSIVNWTSSR